MLWLVAVVWLVYVSECFVVTRQGQWCFAGITPRSQRATDGPAIQIAGGATGLTLLPLAPWATAFVVSGRDWDLEATRSRVREFFGEIRLVQVLASCLGASILVAFPILVMTERVASSFIPWGILTALLDVATIGAFVRAHLRLLPTESPWTRVLPLALSPLGAVRAPSVLSRLYISSVHPLAAAAALNGRDEFLRVARYWYYDDPGSRAEVERVLAQAGVMNQFASPPAAEPGMVKYCPRCLCGYREQASVCRDCAGVELLRLDLLADRQPTTETELESRAARGPATRGRK